MTHLFKLVSIAFVLALASSAQAQTLTFDEMAPTENTILGTVTCGTTAGFLFSSEHFHVTGANFGDPFTSNGTSHLGYEYGRGRPIVMTRLGGGTFALFSIDAGEFHNPPAPDRPDADFLTITGFQQGGGVVTHVVNIDGVRDGLGGVPDYQHFVLPSTFVNLTSVVFTGSRVNDPDGGIAIDNIEYSAGAPETLPACFATAQEPTAPAIAISNPLPGYVSGTVVIQAGPTNGAVLASMQFYLDGVPLGGPVTSAPYQVSWDTRFSSEGVHTISAEGRDAANNVATATVTVTVRNAGGGSQPHYLELDGLDDYLQVPDAPSLSFGNGTTDTPLTIEAWFRPDVMGRHTLVAKWGEGGNQEYQVQIVSGYLRVDLYDNTHQAGAFAFSSDSLASLVGSWHHLAVTYDGRGGAGAANGIAVYVDGVAIGLYQETGAGYQAMSDRSAPLVIGREGPNWKQYDGGLDDIRLWNVARSQSQIQAAMGAELTGSEIGLVGYWRFNEGVGETAADDGEGDHLATLINGPVWSAGGPLVPDTVPPQITGPTSSGLTQTSITVSFQTDEPSTGSVSYSTTTSCPCTVVPSAANGTSHGVVLSGLTADTLYHITVTATDAAGNAQTSAPISVRTLAANADVTPPMVAITGPPAGFLSGTVLVTASASDNVGVTSVQFRVDGVALGGPVTSAPYQASWNTTLVADGTHTISVEARDAANNVAIATATMSVRNTPVTMSPHYLEFDGVNDYAEVADAPGLSFGNGTTDTPLTIELWFRPDAMGRHTLLAKWGETSDQEYELQVVSGFLRFDLKDNARQGSASVFTANSLSGLVGAWHHLAVTYDGRGGASAANGIAVYVDAVSVGLIRDTTPSYVAMANLAAPLVIGREGPSWKQYDGGLDDIRLWNVARTQSQLLASMGVELTGAEAGLVGYWQFNDGVGTSATGNAPGAPSATLFNGPVWTAGGPLVPDTVAPQITGPTSSGVTQTSITVSFQTDEPSTGTVSYSTTTSCPCTVVPSAANGTSHSVVLSGLAADTLYRIAVTATDSAGNAQTSAPISVRTLAANADVTVPTVAITGPPAGFLSGTVLVTASASDNVGVTSVQFRVDGVALGGPMAAAPYQASWNTTLVADGTHTITVEARDAANNVATATATVSVRNTPVVTTPHYLDFDGTDDYVEVADAPGLSFGNGLVDTPLTIELWFRPDAMGRHTLLAKWGETSDQEYELQIVSGFLRFDLKDNARQGSASVFTANSLSGLVGAWHHLAVTYDGRGGATAADGITIYVDGVSVPLFRETTPAYVAMANLAAPLVIGREGPSWKQYDGGLDDIRLWNVARTAGELLASMNLELTGAEPGLVGYWQFNDGAGTSAAGNAPGAPNGVLVNGPIWTAGGVGSN